MIPYPGLKEKEIRQESSSDIGGCLRGVCLFLSLLLVFQSSGCMTVGTSSVVMPAYKAAKKLYQQKKYAEAREEFGRLHAENPESLVSTNINYYLHSSERKIEDNRVEVEAQLDNVKQSKEAKVLKEIEGLIPEDLRAYERLPLHTPSPEDEFAKETAEEARLITNVFFETDIREALRDVSAQAGIPLVAEDTVQGLVSLEMEDMPLDDVLEMMLASGGYTYKEMDGYYLIGTAEPGSPTFNRLTTTKYIKPTYFSAAEVSGLISPSFSPFVQVSDVQNVLTITAPDEIMHRIETDIGEIDKAPRQIILQAVVTDINKSGIETLSNALNWTFNTLQKIDNETTGEVKFAPSSLNSIGLTYETTGKFTRSLISSIQALVETGEATIRATPRISTLDGKKARIFIGKQEMFSVTSGPVSFPTTQLETIDAGIVLDITPRISESGDINVTIDQAEVSHVEARGDLGLPKLSKRTVSTTVRVRDEETIVIGGLLQRKTNYIEKKIPLLSDIPLLGHIFRSVSHEDEETEVLILITPHILRDDDFLEIDL